MNLVILDGRISSPIHEVGDSRRKRAHFLLQVRNGDSITVEVRGAGVDVVTQKWEVGDCVQVRGRLGTGGLVAADSIQRTQKYREQKTKTGLQLSWTFAGHKTAENPAHEQIAA